MMIIHQLQKLRAEFNLSWYDYDLNVANRLIDEFATELKERSVVLMVHEKIKNIEDCIERAEINFNQEEEASGRSEIKYRCFVQKKARTKEKLSVLLKRLERRLKKNNLQKNG